MALVASSEDNKDNLLYAPYEAYREEEELGRGREMKTFKAPRILSNIGAIFPLIEAGFIGLTILSSIQF